MKNDFFPEHQFNEAKLIESISNLTSTELFATEENSKGFNFLHAAAYYGLDKVLGELLKITPNEGFNKQDKKRRTLIHHLASNGRSTILKEILHDYAGKIDIEQINHKGRTPLHTAAKHLHCSTAELLITRGANPNVFDVDGQTPLSLAYTRDFTGRESASRHDVVEMLLQQTQYWKKKLSKEYDSFEEPEKSTTLFAWHLGMKHATDHHWIPGIQLPLEVVYTVKQVYGTKLSQFVLLEHKNNDAPPNTILLCLDHASISEKSVKLREHVSCEYISSLEQILPLLRKEIVPTENLQIWGIELAGIDAQWFALKLSIPIKRLILINSPGLPNNLSTNINIIPRSCYYFFAPQDLLHLMGQYLWYDNATFYTTSTPTQLAEMTSESASPFLKYILADLHRQKAINQKPVLIRLEKVYVPGEDYMAEKKLRTPVKLQDNGAEIQRRFDETSLAIKTMRESNLDNADEFTYFARYEYCAHDLAYMHLTNDQALVRWWESATLLSLYRIIHHQGLYCYLLRHKQEWILQFQGSDFTDPSSASRDLDRGGAGIKRIRQQYVHIIEALIEQLEKLGSEDSIKLVICGHSLGGADAQNFFAALLASLARLEPDSKQEINHELKKFMAEETKYRRDIRGGIFQLKEAMKEIHLYAYNGAGIRLSTANLAKAAAAHLKNKEMVIRVNHQRVRHDIVNVVGQTTLHDFDANHVKVRSLFFEGRENFVDRIQTAHRDRQFSGKTIGECSFFEGKDGSSDLQKRTEEPGGKVEPDTPLFNQGKKLLQKGRTSDSIFFKNF